MSSSLNLYRTKAMKNLVASVRSKAEVKTYIPDEIVMDILSRLPPKDVFRYKSVCRRWRDLISSEDFVDLHILGGLRCTVPMILVEDRKKHQSDQIFLDKWWVPARKKARIHRLGDSYPGTKITHSQEGFLVLRSDDYKEIIITNPIHAEKVRIILQTEPFWSTKVYGIFFNQILKEYCLLLGVTENRSIQYKILNLGPKPCVRQISNHRGNKSLSGHGRPVVVGEHLYWLVTTDEVYRYINYADIMQFDTKTEGFTLLRYPGMKTTGYVGFDLDLLNIDGFLSVVRMAMLESAAEVTIWILRDRDKESWTSSSYCFSWEVLPQIGRCKALAYKDRELIIQSSRRLLVCNLSTGTFRNFGKKTYGMRASFFSHVISLASLKNCKSKIFLEGADEEDKNLDRLDEEDEKLEVRGIS